MNEIIVTIMLLIPSPHKLVDWSVNKVPTQIQLTYESGLEVSYAAVPVSCKSRPKHKHEMIFRSTQEHCYLVYDLNDPQFIRHPYFWYKIQTSQESKEIIGE